MDRELRQFIETVESDVQALVYSEGEGATFEDKFTEYCIEVLEGVGETEGARVCYYSYPGDAGKDWKINGYCLRDAYKDEKISGYETLDLFITYYQNNFEYSIGKDVLQKSLNQIKRFLNSALKKHIDYVDPSHELFELIKIIGSQGNQFDRVNVFFLINGFSSHAVEKLVLKGYELLGIYVHVWDIERLFKLSQSTGTREPLQIDLKEMTADSKPGIQCLKIPGVNKSYECYLAIVPGTVLASLYKEYSSKLLESNVRAFLGQTGKFNKGIRDTIREKPEMFLPYNNGLSATADLVETVSEDNQLYITRINDFQIVNGGQTTASIYHTQKKYKDADLSQIFVQMKLTVVRDQEQKNIEVPNIARYANSQNKVTELDLSSNNAFFIKVEELSRRKYVINPENKGQQILWFFERVNGQYQEALNRLTPTNQKIFKEKNPSGLKFTKSDIAKHLNLWDKEPHQVSFGSQKNFIHYMKKVTTEVSKGKLPGENFYRKLIASAILHKSVDQLFGRKGVDSIGDTNVKSYTVAYAVSYFHHLTDNRLDLWRIYEQQVLDDQIKPILKDLLVRVYNHLVTGASRMLLSEYAKKDSTWDELKDIGYRIDLSTLSPFLVSKEESISRENEKEVDTSEVENELVTESKILTLGLRFWDGLKAFIHESGSFKEIEYAIWDLLTAIQTHKSISSEGLRAGKRILESIEANQIDVDKVRSLSTIDDKELANLKAVYDRMKLLNKGDWARIVDLSLQTKMFDYLELANIKSISRAVLKNEKINSASLVKAHESLKKLKEFGIKY